MLTPVQNSLHTTVFWFTVTHLMFIISLEGRLQWLMWISSSLLSESGSQWYGAPLCAKVWHLCQSDPRHGLEKQFDGQLFGTCVLPIFRKRIGCCDVRFLYRCVQGQPLRCGTTLEICGTVFPAS